MCSQKGQSALLDKLHDPEKGLTPSVENVFKYFSGLCPNEIGNILKL